MFLSKVLPLGRGHCLVLRLGRAGMGLYWRRRVCARYPDLNHGHYVVRPHGDAPLHMHPEHFHALRHQWACAPSPLFDGVGHVPPLQ